MSELRETIKNNNTSVNMKKTAESECRGLKQMMILKDEQLSKLKSLNKELSKQNREFDLLVKQQQHEIKARNDSIKSLKNHIIILKTKPRNDPSEKFIKKNKALANVYYILLIDNS